MSRIKFVASLLLVFAISSNSFAKPAKGPRDDFDTPGLLIEVVAGWGGFADHTMPVPVSFLIRNDSDRNIEGILALKELSTGMEISLGEVVVAPNSTRRVSSIRSLNGWYDCRARLSHGSQVLWQRQLDLYAGKSFDLHTNYVLFVDRGGRKLDLPGPPPNAATKTTYESRVAGLQGRSVECLTVKPWQMTNHPGPLFVAQAMIFAEGASEKDLNQVQWKAVAEWMCQGGVIFVHNASRELIDRLIESSPLGTEPSMQTGRFQTRRFGAGAIYEYDVPLMTSDSIEIRKSIATTVAALSKNHTNVFSNWTYCYSQPQASQASRNRSLTIGLFVCYALITGGGALVLFRFSQRTIAIFTITIVVATSCLAAMLGGYLRISKGDLRLITMTQAAVGGLIQTADLEIQSAGGRNTRIGIIGERPDLQFVGNAEQHYYSYYGPAMNMSFPPFDWQPTLEPNEADRYSINVPMSPWGRRQCHATAFHREAHRVNIELKFDPDTTIEKNEQQSAETITMGQLSVKLENPLPFRLTDCWLILGTTHDCPPNSKLMKLNKDRYSRGMYQEEAKPVDDLIDLYEIQRLQNIAAGGTLETKFPLEFRIVQSYTNISDVNVNFIRSPFRLTRMGATSIWLVARLADSPIIKIDEQRSDFTLQQEIHLYVQELTPDEIPDGMKYLIHEKPSPANEEPSHESQ